MPLPEPYVARPYRGPSDHAAMVSILIEYREHAGASERPTVEQFGVTYANAQNPGGAFHVYTRMGFQLRAYEAIYAKPL